MVAPGTRFGPYEVLSALGAGGMGEVYRARDTRLERTVAIKVLPPHLADDPERRARFEREARAASALNHPHICTLHDIGRQDGVDYLVLEYVDGETLADRLQKGPLPLEQALRVGAQLADALDKAHRAGIVHRDLKPGNVVLTKSGAKLLDFGLARVADGFAGPGTLSTAPTRLRPLTEAGALLGTYQYMAPEQLEGQEADARTDIFALGSVLYEMVTGRRAFEGKSQASLIGAILKDEPPPISKLQPMTPPALDRLVRRCLAKDPDARWQSAADVAAELEWIAERGSPEAAPAATARSRVRERLAWAAAGLLLLAVLYRGRDLPWRREAVPRATHSFLLAPEKTSFRLTGDDGAPVVLSPDGERAAFGADNRLWVYSLRTGAASALASTDAARFPFWSSDSRFIGFFAEGKLRTVEASGGPVLTLCSANNPRGGTWNREGVIVFAPDIRTGLWRVSASGGEPSALTRVDGALHTTHRWPSFLPDGRHFLYLAANHASIRSEQSGIFAASLDGGEPRRVLSSYGSAQYASGYLLFVREASLLAQRFDAGTLTLAGEPTRVADEVGFDSGVWRGTFSASQNGLVAYHNIAGGVGGRFTWYDRFGRALETIGERSEAYAPELSPDARRLAFLVGDPSNDVWVQELDRGVRTRVTTQGAGVVSPLWSADGTEILYVTQQQDGFSLVATAANGAGQPRVLYQQRERMEPTDRSRDGRFLLFANGEVGVTRIFVLPLAGPHKPFPLTANPFVEHSGQFSPDGHWVAYSSRETGRDEVYVASFPGSGTRVQVSGGGGRTPRWRGDGRELYFVATDSTLMSAAVDGTGGRFVVREVKPLFRADLFTGPRTSLTAYDVTSDGQRFLVNSAADTGEPRVVLISNWLAELSR
jgi:serine/threonine protein kinase/Tol biopolymer transport system component